MEAKIYNVKGKEVGNVALDEKVFGVSWNADLVHDVVTSLLSSARSSIAHTKDRGEVRGGGKKPWQQKGTGRARHGSRRSPIWVGGGVTHGPRNEKNYERKVNKKAKAKAFACILSKKLKDGEILFVDGFAMSEPKTKVAKEVISSLSNVKGFESLATKRKNTALIATELKNKNIEKSFNNFSNMSVAEIRNLNLLDVLKLKYLVIENPEKSLSVLVKRVTEAK